MKTIWKYHVPVTDEFEIGMPFGAYILDVQVQSFKPCMWAVVDPAQILVTRKFKIFGTGNLFDLGFECTWEYIGTFQTPPFVWHLFEDFGPIDFEQDEDTP